MTKEDIGISAAGFARKQGKTFRSIKKIQKHGSQMGMIKIISNDPQRVARNDWER